MIMQVLESNFSGVIEVLLWFLGIVLFIDMGITGGPYAPHNKIDKRESSTFSLLKKGELVAIVEPATDGKPARRHCDERFLQEYSERLTNSRPYTGSDRRWGLSFRSSEFTMLTLEFANGQKKEIQVSPEGEKLLKSVRIVTMDGNDLVVMSPGLPDLPGTRRGRW